VSSSVDDDAAVARAYAAPDADAAIAVAVWQEGRASWPVFRVDPVRFGTWLRTIGLAGLRASDVQAADLFLVAACVEGDRVALAEFDRAHLAPASSVLRRAGYDAALVDEAIQLLRYRLLVTTPEREAKLLTYRGRGTLAGWLRVVALRQARALLGPRTPTFDSSRAPAADPMQLEVALLARDHGPRVRALLRTAIGKLDERSREALRLEIVEGVPHHQIAALWNVHRTTVVRKIEDARNEIARAVRVALRAELAIGAESVDSLLRTLAGVELSLASALLGSKPPVA
jgi:RNA polymerase sigma-70 factor (ECF subfamily)